MSGTRDMRGKARATVRIKMPAGMRATAPIIVCVLFLLLALSSTAGAVTFIQQANRLQLIYAALLDFRPGQSPNPVERSAWSLAFELIPMPEVDTRIGAKDEPIDSPPFVPRLRLRWVARWGLLLGISLNPDLEVQNYSAPWTAFELGLRGTVGGLGVELRAHTIDGVVEGPITDSETKDRFEFENRGVDLRVGLPLGRWSVYGGGGKSGTVSALLVASDGARIALDDEFTYLLAGIEFRGEDWTFTLEQNRTGDYLYHVILSLSFGL